MRVCSALVLWLAACSAYAQTGLQVQYDNHGLTRIAFAGEVLEDTTRWPDDALHVWHMKCSDAATGRVRQDGEYGWGENHRARTWDPASHIATYSFVWGQIRVGYTQAGDTLAMQLEEMNRPGSGIVFDGASVYPATLHLPAGASVGGIADGGEGPALSNASWPAGSVAVSSPDAVYAGFQPGKDGGSAVIVSSTAPDALPEAAALTGRPVHPGETARFTVSLTFSGKGAEPMDFLRAWGIAHPMKLNWPDRRLLGTVYLASSGQGDKSRPAGFPTNPRRYFNDPSVDIETPQGLRRFQERVLAQASAVVVNLRRMNAQGAITWDIEGEQYPQSTSYVCAPDQIAQVAPEMETVVAAGLPYAGQKLDDAYFQTIREAGFRVGVCVRPQHFTLAPDGSASQHFLPVGQVAAELIRKMRWAHDRWGATLFYLDSTVREMGWPLPAAVIDEAAAALPDSLLIPEESTPRMYASTAPFRSFLFHGDTGVPEGIRLFYPHAFAANLVNDVDPAKLAAHRAELVESVRRGDILMVHADSWNPNNATVMEIYREAGRR